MPPLLGGTELVIWRLDEAKHAGTWDSGVGASYAGGRWNSRGRNAVYCALDPATAILEVAVHKGFGVLDTVPHVLTSAVITDPFEVHVIQPAAVPNPNWLRPFTPGANQQRFGDDLLAAHRFFAIPSAVSTYSWNLLFDPAVAAASGYKLRFQEHFALDLRLVQPTPAR